MHVVIQSVTTAWEVLSCDSSYGREMFFLTLLVELLRFEEMPLLYRSSRCLEGISEALAIEECINSVPT